MRPYIYRNLERKHLVLCIFDYDWKGKWAEDSIMISVDKSDEILPEFEKITKLLRIPKASIKLYYPDNGQASF